MKKLLSLLIVVLILVICIYYYVSSRHSSQDALIKTETEKAVAMLQSVYDQSQKDGLTIDQAKKIGADKLRTVRYGADNQGYFWADTVQGINMVHATKPEIEGKNRYLANINGIYYIRELIKHGIQPGGGFTDYYFPKPGEQTPSKKRSYSLLFKPFGWVVGTGYYPEDVK
ncbi:MAG: cache domain-containing protein [Candidatus Saganbacteria bacterium]|nr:cache domain-containing protein [Candidatus Saganbacteria bacterium]